MFKTQKHGSPAETMSAPINTKEALEAQTNSLGFFIILKII